MGGLIMKKILSILLLLAFLGGSVEDKASASADELPKLRIYSVIDQPHSFK